VSSVSVLRSLTDDLLLVSISIHDMQNMINLCRTEFDWLDMSINIKKSTCIRIGNRFNALTKELYVNDRPISWCKEMRYLGIVIKAASVFKCNFHDTKVKFFRSLNGLLSKLGSSPQINLTLSLTSTFCNSILFYGLEALRLNKTDISLLTFPYNSVFVKLFSSFDRTVLMLCQYYTGQLPLGYSTDLRTLNFYADLSVASSSPANILYKWFGDAERMTIAQKYDILDFDSPGIFKRKVHMAFENYAKTVL
jgi:hypothetical protein